MCNTPASRRPPGGLTLIELMVVVAVVGILAAIAYPSFMDSVRKSRRSDAFAALSAVQQAQERLRSNQSSYANSVTALPTANPPGLGLGANSAKGYYAISIDSNTATATGYTATAAALAGTSQAGDANCQSLSVRVDRGNIDYGAGTSSPNWSDPHRCWVR